MIMIIFKVMGSLSFLLIGGIPCFVCFGLIYKYWTGKVGDKRVVSNSIAICCTIILAPVILFFGFLTFYLIFGMVWGMFEITIPF